MRSRYTFWLMLLSALATVVLAGCRGGGGSTTTITPPPPAITVTIAGAGTGTVTSSPAGINCPTTCSASFAQNSQITLSETPGTNNTFAGWSGACTGTASCSVTLSAASSVIATFTGPIGSLQNLNHIIIFAQENRSFDHYFGAMREYWAQNGIPDQQFDGLPQFNPATGIAPLQGPAPAIEGCDPAYPYIPPNGTTGAQNTSCIPNPSDVVTSFHMASMCTEEPSPFWDEAHIDWDLNDPTGVSPAALNGFVVTAANDARQASPALNDTNGLRAMGYFDGGDLNYYYFMASNFSTSDRWFTPVMSRTQLNRAYLLAATSAGHVYPYTGYANTTIFEELQNAGITWKVYLNSEAAINQSTGAACNNDISDANAECLIQSSYINMFTYEQTIINSAGQNPDLLQHIVPVTQFTVDAQNGTLPQVALIEPASAAALDEHPNDTDTESPSDIEAGANYASGLINALMASPSWKDSAMIFTYDEFGGFYDHVSPQPMPSPDGIQPIDLQPQDVCDGVGQIGTGTCDFTHTGYRVPLIVISPFARKNYVSHTVYDYTAILTLIEKRFGVPALTKRDAAQADMSTDFFNFVNPPWTTPPAPPAQITNGQCFLTAPTP
jgi:phospholipase C